MPMSSKVKPSCWTASAISLMSARTLPMLIFTAFSRSDSRLSGRTLTC